METSNATTGNKQNMLWDVTEPDLRHRVEIARLLNRGGVSAAPLRRLDVISIYDDDEYENYDFDLVSPRRRLKIAALLTEAGYRQKSGSKIVAPDGGPPVLIPKPGILGSDPSRPAEALLSKGNGVVVATPTQAVLLYLHHFGREDDTAVADELTGLVWEQPANLDKVQDWARAAGLAGTFARLRNRLETSQAEGIDLRRRKRFRSKLPR
ncbi:MAG: hypothetical protein AAF560_22930 [Acidobacteriota bacterium]